MTSLYEDDISLKHRCAGEATVTLSILSDLLWPSSLQFKFLSKFMLYAALYVSIIHFTCLKIIISKDNRK